MGSRVGQPWGAKAALGGSLCGSGSLVVVKCRRLLLLTAKTKKYLLYSEDISNQSHVNYSEIRPEHGEQQKKWGGGGKAHLHDDKNQFQTEVVAGINAKTRKNPIFNLIKIVTDTEVSKRNLQRGLSLGENPKFSAQNQLGEAQLPLMNFGQIQKQQL